MRKIALLYHRMITFLERALGIPDSTKMSVRKEEIENHVKVKADRRVAL